MTLDTAPGAAARTFLGPDFLLGSATARRLFAAAGDVPIVDYHCHLSAQELADDRRFASITEVWLGADHYKWRLMRGAGVDERLITGAADDWEKFHAFATVLGRAIGNPIHHWSHLELQRYFGIHDVLDADSARDIYDRANEQLQRPEFSARGLVKASGVEVICTTDDPLDALEHHEALAAATDFDTLVVPGFRPDGVLRIERDAFGPYVERLAHATGIEVAGFDGLVAALEQRIAYFDARGCTVSDQSLEIFPKRATSDAEADAILRRRLAGEPLTARDADDFRWALMRRLAKLYHARDWVMELHVNALRDANPRAMRQIGHDTGFDAIGEDRPIEALREFLGELEADDTLPRTLLFTVDEGQNKQLAVLATCFPGSGIAAKVQLGNAWWFNDTIAGMAAQIRTFAEVGYLPAAVGMVTDSRSFLSYPRHEYFRRIVVDIVAQWVDSGEFPASDATLESILRDIFHDNSVRYFRFDVPLVGGVA
ncbi:glucuronate isomerase [Microbacterium rhizophilus]|uniref:glucuronate isomerase n=1 Tax=Microbacterium rhizophilus TaxID=3138934 RepID=UPI0031F107F4